MLAGNSVRHRSALKLRAWGAWTENWAPESSHPFLYQQARETNDDSPVKGSLTPGGGE